MAAINNNSFARDPTHLGLENVVLKVALWDETCRRNMFTCDVDRMRE